MERWMDVIKRVMAWILLIGFVTLLSNIFMFQFYLKESLFMYVLIAVTFMFIYRKTTF